MAAHGNFTWYELMTTDTAAAARFYGEVLGWKTRPLAEAAFEYHTFETDEMPTGGLMRLPKEACEAGARPGWLGYIAANNLDQTLQQLSQAGGHVHRAPENIQGVGRFAVVADPQGAAFILFQEAEPSDPPKSVGWHELYAGEWEEVFRFYSAMFGWKKDQAMNMGEMGTYQLFASGGDPIGGMLTKPASIPAPFWLYYFRVPDIEDGEARVVGHGGQVLMGPMEVPGGSMVLHCLDPQGAMFALISPPAA